MTTRERTADIKATLNTIEAKVNTTWTPQDHFISTIRLADQGETTRAWTRLHQAGYNVAQSGKALTV
jgi:hypothetical protein